MKIVQFTYNDKPREIRVGYFLNLKKGDFVVDLNRVDYYISPSLLGILRNGEMERVTALYSSKPRPKTIPFSDVTLKAPILGMDKVICVGLNYEDFCSEARQNIPRVPVIFSKFSSTVVGPNDSIEIRSDVTEQVDYQVELCIVIGKTARLVTADDACDYILGYTVAQNIIARDLQYNNGGQFLLGSSMDTFCPIGPWVVTTDELINTDELNIKCSINNYVKQNSNTNQIIHKIPDLIERLSSVMTLLPGDIILTGTPGGVGAYARPPNFLKPGDIIHSEIENIGILETNVKEFQLEDDNVEVVEEPMSNVVLQLKSKSSTLRKE